MSIRVIGAEPIGFLERVSLGLEPGCDYVVKFGYNADIDSGSGFEAVWGGGGEYTGFNATSAETLEIFSSKPADAVGSTGAREVRLYGLDADGHNVEETVALTGAVPVTTTTAFLRMPRARILSAGSGGENAGVITIRQSVTTANVFAKMQKGTNRTLIAAYTIPAGKSGYLVAWTAAAAKGGGNESQVRLVARPVGGVFEILDLRAVVGVGTSTFQHDYSIWPKFGPLTDIQIIANASGNNAGVSGDFHLILIDEP